MGCIDVGDEVVVKATKVSGLAKQSNGHACKVGDRWYHIDELEAPESASAGLLQNARTRCVRMSPKGMCCLGTDCVPS
eukprot:Skav236418  [mRNA]  locus=scaffold4540:118327:124008:- [translate_table: standard]